MQKIAKLGAVLGLVALGACAGPYDSYESSYYGGYGAGPYDNGPMRVTKPTMVPTITPTAPITAAEAIALTIRDSRAAAISAAIAPRHGQRRDGQYGRGRRGGGVWWRPTW
jgi:hypothetical protein